ncbi:MAG: M14 family zinc carboxypeptidase, partial [Acidobacteriota bacterium]
MTPTLSLLVLLTVSGAPYGEVPETPWLAAPPASVGALDPPARLDPDVPSPASILGYPPGAQFTYHHRILDVIDRMAAASPRLRVESYGQSVEERPLRLVVASAPRHLDRLDAVLDARRRAVVTGDLGPLRDLPAIVWIGFGIHGNETSSPEAAMAILHLLAAAEDGSTPASWLDQLIVVVDPVSNPDGRERYVQWYRSTQGRAPDADVRALEHQEPWPGGRQNHYLFDLNRDWAWATQVETRARLTAFRRFQPDVAIDVHEMRPDATYFFPPAADPAHPRIASSVHEWLNTFGRANADAFDRRAWPYFVREVYDFFYPGYGDTYPSLIGAVGMTFEMAGGGRAGAVLDLDDGRRRTLAGRTARHTLAVLTTLTTAAADPRGLARDTVARRRDAGGGAYVWSAAQAEAAALAELLTMHGISVGRLGSERSLDVEPILPGDRVRRTFDRDAFVAVAEAPYGRLLHGLMERAPNLSPAFVDRQRARIEAGLDVEIYDVTAWSLPLAFGVETWRVDTPVETVPATPTPPTWPLAETARQGWLVRPQGLVGYRLAARLLADGVRLRRLVEPELSPALPGGSLFIPRQANPADLDARIERAVTATGARIEAVGSAWTEDGPSLGSGRWRPTNEPRVGLLAGRGI